MRGGGGGNGQRSPSIKKLSISLKLYVPMGKKKSDIMGLESWIYYLLLLNVVEKYILSS